MKRLTEAAQIAVKIQKVIEFVNKRTAPCGSNPIFYNEISRELMKLNLYNVQKLNDILTNVIVLERLKQ